MTADWTVLDEPGVEEAVLSAARKVADRYSFLDVDDMAQEGRIAVATHAQAMREALSVSAGVLHHRVYCDLLDAIKGEARQRIKEVPILADIAEVVE